eukprot:1556335-Rhodomonas_salina.2
MGRIVTSEKGGSPGPAFHVSGITAALLYGTVSSSMTFCNKALSQEYGFNYPLFLLMIQVIFFMQSSGLPALETLTVVISLATAADDNNTDRSHLHALHGVVSVRLPRSTPITRAPPHSSSPTSQVPADDVAGVERALARHVHVLSQCSACARQLTSHEYTHVRFSSLRPAPAFACTFLNPCLRLRTLALNPEPLTSNP